MLKNKFTFFSKYGHKHIIDYDQFQKEFEIEKDKNVLLIEIDENYEMCRYSLNDKCFFEGNFWDYHLAFNFYECECLEEIEKVFKLACSFGNIPLTIVKQNYQFEY